MKAILVDDEESARDVLENLLLRFCPEIELVAKCSNVETAVTAIKTHQPSIVFLDIEMPNFAGYEIVQFFEEIDFQIIFVTAYDKYAVRAFEVAAVDYLLKPVDIQRLKLAVQKAEERVNLEANAKKMQLLSETLESNELKNLAVIDRGYQHIVDVQSIIAIEAQESYSTIFTAEKKYTASKNLKHFERIFSETPDFIRVHKSWIVNKNHILNYSKSELQINLVENIVAKLSKYKKAEFEAVMFQ